MQKLVDVSSLCVVSDLLTKDSSQVFCYQDGYAVCKWSEVLASPREIGYILTLRSLVGVLGREPCD